MAEKRKVLAVACLFSLSSNKHLVLLLISSLVLAITGLIFISINILDSSAGYGYAKNSFENSININSWTIPNNESIHGIIYSELFNYTIIKTLASYYVESLCLRSTILFGVFLFFISSVIPVIFIDTHNSSETKYVMIIHSGSKISYFDINTIVSIITVLPLFFSSLMAYFVFFSWISPEIIYRTIIFIMVTCILPAISSIGLYMATSSKEISFFYGAYVPILAIILPDKINYYFPLTKLIYRPDIYSVFFSILPYLALYFLMALAYHMRGGIK